MRDYNHCQGSISRFFRFSCSRFVPQGNLTKEMPPDFWNLADVLVECTMTALASWV